MYDKEIISTIINHARIIVDEKRKKYDHIMKVIEIFISENDIIVKESSEYYFDLYTFDMFNLPMKLTNLIYETDPKIAKYVSLEVKIYKYNSRITIDGILFVNFTYINSEIRQNILDYTCKGIHTKSVYKCFGPEILLINLYADLVNPSLYNEWTSIFKNEEKMSNEIISYLSERIGGGRNYKRSLIDQMIDFYFGDSLKLSSKRVNKKYNIDLEYSLQSNVNPDMNKYKKIVLTNFICDQHVLVGKNAVNVYNNIDHLDRIQIITSRSLMDEVKILKGFLGSSITYSVNNLKIPTNLNLHKMTIFYEKNPILDIYDAGNFEVISYNIMESKLPKNINIGSPFVVMRFRLVDIWSTLFNMKAGNLSKEIAMPVVRKLINDYVSIRNKIKSIPISEIFSLNYIGYYEDQQLNKMRIAARLKVKFIKPYFPYLANK